MRDLRPIDDETITLPFFERNVLTETTHLATATWVEANLHPGDLTSGTVYVVRLVIEKPNEAAFNFLWPLRYDKRDDGSALWRFPVQPMDRPWPEAELDEGRFDSVVGIVVDISRESDPVDLPFPPGFRFS